MPIKFWIYITKKFLLSVFITLLIISCIIFLSDFIEVLRRSFGYNIAIYDIFTICLYKLPYFIQILLPFVILIATSITIATLNRNNELIAARAAGFSIWNILTPFLVTAFLIGTLEILIFNPIVAITLKKHMILDSKFLDHHENDIIISDKGIWLKEVQDKKLDKLIFAKSLYDRGKFMSEVTLVDLSKSNFDLNSVYLADLASINDNKITMIDVKKINKDGEIHNFPRLEIPTNISVEKLQESIDIPEIIQFFDLENFIKYMKKGGFSTIKHSMYFYQLLFTPLFLSALVILASASSLSLPRNGKISIMMIISIAIGFIVYFITKTLYALGNAGTIPVLVSTSASSILCIMFSLSYLLHKEDG